MMLCNATMASSLEAPEVQGSRARKKGSLEHPGTPGRALTTTASYDCGCSKCSKCKILQVHDETLRLIGRLSFVKRFLLELLEFSNTVPSPKLADLFVVSTCNRNS